jgi:hypothetical protein
VHLAIIDEGQRRSVFRASLIIAGFARFLRLKHLFTYGLDTLNVTSL